MNEVEELSKLDIQSLPPLRPMVLDDLHSKALKNLHLELGAGPVLYLLSPLLFRPPSHGQRNDHRFLHQERSAFWTISGRCIIRNLAVYSVLLDINSYFVEQNSFLVLARLREKDSGGRRFEIKFYTNSPLELTSHYEDKIYIGRDFIDLFNFKRKHFGVKELIVSVKDQNEKMIDKAQEKLKNPLEYKSFFQEIKELGRPSSGRRASSSSSPSRRISISPRSAIKTSSTSTPSTGRSTTTSSSSMTRSRSSRTSCTSTRRTTSPAT